MRVLACENIRFSTLFAAGDVSRGGTSARNVPAANSEEKRMFSQAMRVYKKTFISSLHSLEIKRFCESRSRIN